MTPAETPASSGGDVERGGSARFAELVRACAIQLQSHVMLCRGPNNVGQTELSHDEYREVVRIVLAAAARFDGAIGAKPLAGASDPSGNDAKQEP